MEAKKTPKADLEKRRGLYLEIGLVVILALALVAFNIKSYDKEVKEVNTRVAESEIDAEVLNTPPEELPPPPPPEQEIVATDLKVVENDEQPINEVGLINAEDNANKAQETFVKVEVKEEVEEVEEEVFLVVEDDPEFPGGLSALIGGGCGAEAVRVVKAMPKWKPGKQRGKPVRTQFNLPVDFSLN